MASSKKIVSDAEGWAHTTGLHTHGFTTLLWETLQQFGYTDPPKYMGKEYDEHGVSYCDVLLSIPANEARPEWEPWTVRAKGSKLNHTLEIAAHQALTQFCEDHVEELEGKPAALVPISDQSNPIWRKRISDVCDPDMPGHSPELAAIVNGVMFVNNLYNKKIMLHEFLQKRIQENCERLQAKDNRIAELTKQLQESTKQVQEKEQRIVEKDEQNEELAKQVQVKEQQIAEKLKQGEELAKQLQAKYQQLGELNKQALDRARQRVKGKPMEANKPASQ